MSQNQQNPTISGALTAPPPQTEDDMEVMPQPRQPANLQGLLRFAMDASKTEDAPANSELLPIDEQRKAFLDNALKSMTVNVIEMLNKSIEVLRNADKLSPESDVSEYLTAFDNILEHVDIIDTAIDFHKIGGFTIFPPCLNSAHAEIRASACDLIAELCQNNPYCQRVVSETDLLEQLLAILDRDSDVSVQIKAIYAKSCNVRENPESTRAFLRLNGLRIVCKALQRPNDKLRTKSAFLLSRLVCDVSIRDLLIKQGIISLLVQLIAEPRRPSHEHLIELLFVLIVDSPQAIDICTQPELQLGKLLKNHLQLVKDKEELRDEAQQCELLLKAVNSVLPDVPEMDR